MIVQNLSARTGVRRPAVPVVLAVVHLGACAAFVPALFSWTALGIAALTYDLTGAIGIGLGYRREVDVTCTRCRRPDAADARAEGSRPA